MFQTKNTNGKLRIKIEFNSETGEVTRTKNSWWGFLAKDVVDEEPPLGNSCSTVSPDSRGECCIQKGFYSYDQEKNECV